MTDNTRPRTAGNVGVPGEGERICRHCEGSGHDLGAVRDRYSVCGICEGTGVLPETAVDTIQRLGQEYDEGSEHSYDR